RRAAHVYTSQHARTGRRGRGCLGADEAAGAIPLTSDDAASSDDGDRDERRRMRFLVFAATLIVGAVTVGAQQVRPGRRPPGQAPGPPRPEDGSAAPDGYAPIPQWSGQTRAPKAVKTAEYVVETVAEGLNGAFCFDFLPDGRIVVGERAGRIRLVGKDGKASDPIGGMPPNLFVRGGQGLYEVRPDRAFATSRTIYLT